MVAGDGRAVPGPAGLGSPRGVPAGPDAVPATRADRGRPGRASPVRLLPADLGGPRGCRLAAAGARGGRSDPRSEVGGPVQPVRPSGGGGAVTRMSRKSFGKRSRARLADMSLPVEERGRRGA